MMSQTKMPQFVNRLILLTLPCLLAFTIIFLFVSSLSSNTTLAIASIHIHKFSKTKAFFDITRNKHIGQTSNNHYQHTPNLSPKYLENELSLVWTSTEADYTTSVVWGDWDGDGDLDLAVGNADGESLGKPNYVYENLEGDLVLAWISPESDQTTSLAWGDWDGDGDLDLAVGNEGFSSGDPDRVYENIGGDLVLAWSAPQGEWTQGIAWIDWDGDGDLDLFVNNINSHPDRIYENVGNDLVLSWTAPSANSDAGMSWGDWDGDKDLDLATSKGIYENVEGNLILTWTVTTTLGSVAWGDWDQDGDPDLATSLGVYENENGNLFLTWTTTSTLTNVYWADWDWDGDLDLIDGSFPIKIYQNDGGSLVLGWSYPEPSSGTSLDFGDWDKDGDLDLAVGKGTGYYIGVPNEVYENTGAGLTLYNLPPVVDIAWGDLDADNDLDLAGSGGIYENEGGNFTLVWNVELGKPAWGDWDQDGDLDLVATDGIYENIGNGFSKVITDSFVNGAWGDIDGDGDLDLATSIGVYENTAGSLILSWNITSTLGDPSWGDWDGDGDLDLAGESGVYENIGGDFVQAVVNNFKSPAWGDWDVDGDLDLVSNCQWHCHKEVYENVGGNLVLAWISPETDFSSSVAWVDWNGDNLLDLIFGNSCGLPLCPAFRVYENNNNGFSLVLSSQSLNSTYGVAWADWDSDNDLDISVAPYWIVQNNSADQPALADSMPWAQIKYPSGAGAPFYASSIVLDEPTIPISYTLFDTEGHTVRFIHVFFSLDGGSLWQPALATSGTITTNLTASPTGNVHVFNWDIFASGVMGASDNVVLRFDIFQGFEGPGPYQRLFRTATTLPFRLRGSQVRVLYEDLPAPNAIVYHKSLGQTNGLEPYKDQFRRPFQTNPAGYLQGHGEIGLGDQLVALLPITATESYTIYYTSAPPILTGLHPYTVTASGVQTLTISAGNPLVLFNLDISLEWDARNDQIFLDRLELDLQRVSELLFDWTNGQAALGKVTIYHAREHWNDADIRIYASNRLHPNAIIGGVVSEVLTETVPLTNVITYAPGEVRMAVTWNRYGDPGSNLGEDWPRALAHELGHYLFFLNDNYLGLDENDLLVSVSICPGVMSDPYTDDDDSGYDEFHPEQDWLEGCENTLANLETGRADWQTIQQFYPWLSETGNFGPNGLPLAITQITFVDPMSPTTTLDFTLFDLLKEEGGIYQATGQARAFLFHEDTLTDLGRPVLDQVNALGASPGDQLCVYDLSAERLGCETVSALDSQLTMDSLPDWQPEIRLGPVTSNTLYITVTIPGLVDTSVVQARLYPSDYAAADVITLNEIAPGTGKYAGAYIELPNPAIEGYVHIWVNEPAPRREIITDFSLGGDPGPKPRGAGGMSPVISPDGQVILYGQDLEFPKGEFYAFQTATILPQEISWATVIGQAYYLLASHDAPEFVNTSIRFSYLGNEVPPGEETFLRIYFWDEVSLSWTPLETQVDTYQNSAVAPVQGPGLYALMSSIEIPLYGPGWNLIGYPVLNTRPVTETLASIDSHYTKVCRYDATDSADPWKCFGAGVPAWVNDMTTMDFGWGYWIYISDTVTLTLRLKGNGFGVAIPDEPDSFQNPPATYYGPILANKNFALLEGMPVTAWVDGNLCGQASTLNLNGQIVFVIDVFAFGTGNASGCGLPGKTVSFQVDDQMMMPVVLWDDSRIWETALNPGFQYYLPLINRE